MENRNTDGAYAFRVHLDVPVAEARARLDAALKEEGFGVLTEVDVKAVMKKKLDADFRAYQILGVCNPQLAHRALSENLDVGMLLPCKAILYEKDGGSEIAILDPAAVSSIIAGLDAVMEDARARLRRVAEALKA